MHTSRKSSAPFNLHPNSSQTNSIPICKVTTTAVSTTPLCLCCVMPKFPNGAVCVCV
ncbi:hypothetical protein E2C01_067524 [Portunus trituberculatus]|uniref:Uncharacterized protein n=1 Tax=Portunus trituberculatus TaxID=210409 RepID=A0A5B7HSV5_PORTR|nr:hypothetical protein [Portunus trituberculatus]